MSKKKRHLTTVDSQDEATEAEIAAVNNALPSPEDVNDLSPEEIQKIIQQQGGPQAPRTLGDEIFAFAAVLKELSGPSYRIPQGTGLQLIQTVLQYKLQRLQMRAPEQPSVLETPDNEDTTHG